MKAQMKNLIFKVIAAALFWALCKNRNLMFSVAKKMIASMTLKELLNMNFDIKDAVKNVK